MLLPMGNLTKARVREIAAERGFLKAAHKRDSLGVCFCPMDYRTFLHKELPEGSILPGKFFDEMGNFIWPLMDGKNTVYDIAEQVKAHFGEKAEPLYNRLVQYMRNLESYGFIRFKE